MITPPNTADEMEKPMNTPACRIKINNEIKSQTLWKMAKMCPISPGLFIIRLGREGEREGGISGHALRCPGG